MTTSEFKAKWEWRQELLAELADLDLELFGVPDPHDPGQIEFNEDELPF